MPAFFLTGTFVLYPPGSETATQGHWLWRGSITLLSAVMWLVLSRAWVRAVRSLLPGPMVTLDDGDMMAVVVSGLFFSLLVGTVVVRITGWDDFTSGWNPVVLGSVVWFVWCIAVSTCWLARANGRLARRRSA